MPVPIVARRANKRLEKLGVAALVHTVEYADDCTGVVTGETEMDCQIAIVIISEEFSRFYNAVGLKQNLEKSELLAIRKCPKTFEFTVGDVTESTDIKLLGLTVQEGFKFNKHVEQVNAKVRVRLHEVSKIQHLLPFEMLKNIVQSLCLSKLYYGMEIYNTSQEITKKIQRIMNIALRLVCHGDMRTRVAEMLEKTGWLNASNNLIMVRMMMLRKILLTRCTRITWSLIQRGSLHQHNTRETRINLSWNPEGAFASNSFLAWSVKKWNELKLSNWEILKKSRFKNDLWKEILKKHPNGNIV